ncbi:MAG: SIMPL domain-containing protein [Acidobacteria bacterium]|nr:SIMPL domain-containing protein [Acidobacteriota bacterium]MCW5949989.1 SIMPL domain-containing protein [Pyrinomonadaceae bacterium]
MKRLLLFSAFLCLFSAAAMSQEKPERRVIEVSGSAERLVTPDTFTFKITLAERIDNKQKITIETQEAQLRTELEAIGVNAAKDLTVFDIAATYIRQKKVRDTLAVKDYRLKLRDINKIAGLQDLADRLNVSKLDLIDTEHSQMAEIRREVKIDAMRAAKTKAEYLLGAIGERAGKPVWVKEVEDEIQLRPVSSNFATSNIVRISAGVLSNASEPSELNFTPFKVRYVIQAKFEIE